MKKTPVITEPLSLIDYHAEYLFLGSCFSEHLSGKMLDSGFTIQANPFGVVFNPITLASVFNASDEEIRNSVFDRKGVALSWLANSTCFAYQKEELQNQMKMLRKKYLTSVKKAKILFVTFGTAWIYTHKKEQFIVGNCHKVPQDEFEKRLLSVKEIVAAWREVIDSISYDNEIQIVFTVSPVRHIKDGAVENMHSKAILLTAIHQLKESYSNVGYFPAYEIMMDELRDYAYYTEDGVHPNTLAINEIWSRFRFTYFTSETQKIYEEHVHLKRLHAHRSLHPKSEESKQFDLERAKKLENFQQKYPFIETKRIIRSL